MVLIFILFSLTAAAVMDTLDLDETAKWFPKLSFKQVKSNLMQFETKHNIPTLFLPRGIYMTLYTTERDAYDWNQIEIEFKAVGDCSLMQFFLLDGKNDHLDNKMYPFNTITNDRKRGYVTIKYLTRKIHAIYPGGTDLFLFIPSKCALMVNHAKREFQPPSLIFEWRTVEHTRQVQSDALMSLFSRAIYLK